MQVTSLHIAKVPSYSKQQQSTAETLEGIGSILSTAKERTDTYRRPIYTKYSDIKIYYNNKFYEPYCPTGFLATRNGVIIGMGKWDVRRNGA